MSGITADRIINVLKQRQPGFATLKKHSISAPKIDKLSTEDRKKIATIFAPSLQVTAEEVRAYNDQLDGVNEDNFSSFELRSFAVNLSSKLSKYAIDKKKALEKRANLSVKEDALATEYGLPATLNQKTYALIAMLALNIAREFDISSVEARKIAYKEVAEELEIIQDKLNTKKKISSSSLVSDDIIKNTKPKKKMDWYGQVSILQEQSRDHLRGNYNSLMESARLMKHSSYIKETPQAVDKSTRNSLIRVNESISKASSNADLYRIAMSINGAGSSSRGGHNR